jgi:hypothetical protein
MPIDFPSSPTTGQKYTYNNITYTFTGTTWTASASDISQLADPILTGAPTAPATIPAADSSTRLATTKFVQDAKAAAIAFTNAAIAAIPPPPVISLEVVGTCIVFHMQAPPTGWTRRTDLNDRALRCVSGAVASGGVQPFSTLFARTSVDATTLDTNTLPSHAHGVADPTHGHGLGDPGHGHGLGDPTHAHGYIGMAGQVTPGGLGDGANNWYQYGAGTDGAYTGMWVGGAGTGMWVGGAGVGIGIYGAGASWGHSHGLDLRVTYVDVIIATKD